MSAAAHPAWASCHTVEGCELCVSASTCVCARRETACACPSSAACSSSPWVDGKSPVGCRCRDPCQGPVTGTQVAVCPRGDGGGRGCLGRHELASMPSCVPTVVGVSARVDLCVCECVRVTASCRLESSPSICLSAHGEGSLV